MRTQLYAIASLLCSHLSLSAQSAVPLPSQFVDCVRDDKSVDVASRTVRTPVFTSKKGSRAFGRVVAKVERGCQNTSTIYVSEHGKPFQVIFEQKAEVEPDDGGAILDGNGVEAIMWSPSSARLLVEISRWVWGSDTGSLTKYVLYRSDRVGKSVEVINPIDAIWKTFKTPCSALIESAGWLDDSRIELTAKPFVSTDEDGIADGTPVCIKKPTRFSFDVETRKLKLLNGNAAQRMRKAGRIAIRNEHTPAGISP